MAARKRRKQRKKVRRGQVLKSPTTEHPEVSAESVLGVVGEELDPEPFEMTNPFGAYRDAARKRWRG